MSEQAQRARIQGLDGLRTLAVFLVLGYHLLVGVFDSGFIGVDVFFVISGFLITSLLIREKEKTGAINILAFWMRRIRRLVPAVVVATLFVVCLARLTGGDSIVQLRWQTLGALTGTYNWLEIAFHSSYFNTFSPLLLTNMWSLAVEQQFYLIWPLILLLIIRFVPRKQQPWIAIAMAVLSFAGNVFFTLTSDDVTRAYVGTDTHSFGLMIGAALALSLPGLLSGERGPLDSKKELRYGIYGWVGLVVVVALAVLVPDNPKLYPWVMLGSSVATLVLIRAMLPDMRPRVATVVLWAIFDSRPMRWIGERSYGIYLWHWPLWVIAYYFLPQSLTTVVLAVIVTVLSFILAHLSYVLIETPIRREGFLAFTRRRVSYLQSPRWIAAALVPTLCLAGVLTWALISSPTKTSAQLFVEAGQKGGLHPPPPPQKKDSQKSGDETNLPMPTGDQITLVGDSVSLGSSAAVQERLPGIYIDAVESRNMTHVPNIIDSLISQNALREYVVVSVAANSTIRAENIEALLEQIGKERKLVLVTGYGPERYCPWIAPTNAVIREEAKKHPKQIRVADWEPIAGEHQDLLADDRVHPNPYTDGPYLFADEIVRALDSF